MSTQTEVYLDDVRGLVAVAWPTEGGYTIYDVRGRQSHAYALPAGMTRLQEPPAAAPPSAMNRHKPIEPGPRRTLAFGA